MFAGKTAINKLENPLENSSSSYNNFTDLHEALLSINDDISIRQKHLRYLAVKVYKTLIEINPEFIWTYFWKYPTSYGLKKVIKCFRLLRNQQDVELLGIN